MFELIKTETGTAVSARELYDFLGIRRDFNTWCSKMFDYGFEEDKDFSPVQGKSTGGRPSKDYAITLDCAKEIAMIQRTEKGKQAREYFIECEKKLSKVKEIVTRSPEQMVLDSMKYLTERVEEQEQRLLLAEQTIKKQAPKVEYTDKVLQANNVHTINIIAKELGMSAVTLNKRLHEMGVQYRNGDTWVLYHKYQDKGYTKTRTYTYTGTNGEARTSVLTCWTERGRAFIHHLLAD